jgi:phosphatidylglycerol:prolipoprotein diacylglycerol transferase
MSLPEEPQAERLDAPEPPPADAPEPTLPPLATSEAVVEKKASYVFLAVVSFVSLVADLGTKRWAEKTLQIGEVPAPKTIIKGVFGFILAKNKGGAWGLLQGQSEKVRIPFFVTVSVLAILFIVSLYRRLHPQQTALKWGLPLVLGGALGNLVDRIRYGSVIDFIDVQATWEGSAHHWPTFNVADIAICIGVGLMAVDMLTARRPKVTPSTVPPPVDASLPPSALARPPMRPTLYWLHDVIGALAGSSLDAPLPAYFVMLLSGFVLAIIVQAMTARRIGHDPDVMVDLGLAMLLAGVVGSRVLHVLADGYFWDYVHLCTDPAAVDWKVTPAECASSAWNGTWDAAKGVCHPQMTPFSERLVSVSRGCWTWAAFWAGGLTYYGGFLGAVPVGWYVLKRDRFPFWKAADLAGFTVAIGLVWGRMGCLLAGCCFGVVSHSDVALVFPPGSAASEWQEKHGLLATRLMPSQPVLPMQIFEAAASLAIAAALGLWLWPRKRYDGQVFVAFMALYSIARFVLEIWRSDDRGGTVGLSTSQLIGVFLVGAAVWVHRFRSKLVTPVPAA